jgi:hypothetical protein
MARSMQRQHHQQQHYSQQQQGQEGGEGVAASVELICSMLREAAAAPSFGRHFNPNNISSSSSSDDDHSRPTLDLLPCFSSLLSCFLLEGLIMLQGSSSPAGSLAGQPYAMSPTSGPPFHAAESPSDRAMQLTPPTLRKPVLILAAGVQSAMAAGCSDVTTTGATHGHHYPPPPASPGGSSVLLLRYAVGHCYARLRSPPSLGSSGSSTSAALLIDLVLPPGPSKARLPGLAAALLLQGPCLPLSQLLLLAAAGAHPGSCQMWLRDHVQVYIGTVLFLVAFSCNSGTSWP